MVSLQRKRVVPRAHHDDIHGLVSLPGQSREFISGSKDAFIKIWSQTGAECRRVIGDTRRKSYKNWITALTASTDRMFSASRDGYITSWDHNGARVGGICVGHTGDAPISKPRNKDRVHCLLSLQNELPGFADDVVIAGMARQAVFWDHRADVVSGTAQVHTNDWLYAMLLLTSAAVPTFALVIGSALEVHELHHPHHHSGLRFEKVCDVWGQKHTSGRHQQRSGSKRPHIASIVRIDDDHLAGGCFDGVVRVFDLRRNVCTLDMGGHRERVWDVVAMPTLGPSVLASGADDQSLCLWDTRCQNQMIFRDTNFPGRVSSLLAVDDGRTLIAASCANDPHTSGDKGCLYVYDVRFRRAVGPPQSTPHASGIGSSDGGLWDPDPPTELLARLSVAPTRTGNTTMPPKRESIPKPSTKERTAVANASDVSSRTVDTGHRERDVVVSTGSADDNDEVWQTVGGMGKNCAKTSEEHRQSTVGIAICESCGVRFKSVYKGPLPRCRKCFSFGGLR